MRFLTPGYHKRIGRIASRDAVQGAQGNSIVVPALKYSDLATATGNSLSFSSPFNTVTRAIVMTSDLSTNGTTDDTIIQIGSGGTATDAGYAGKRNHLNEAAAAWAGSGAQINRSLSAANALTGKVYFDHMGGNQWIIDGLIDGDNAGNLLVTAGEKTLSGAMNIIVVTLTGTPTDDFDAGTVRVAWYGY